MGFVSSLRNYAAQPFSEDQDMLHWFLFTGLILICVVLWIMVIRTITAIE